MNQQTDEARPGSTRVLAWVPQVHDTSPGQRFRIEQWEPWMAEAGLQVSYSPFMSADLRETLLRRGPAFF